MSIAAALSLQRQQHRAPPSHAPKYPRRELAAIALNGIDALAPIDPTLRTLSPALLLHTPHQDRATLPPEKQAELSDAIVTTLRRLSPVLALRHAQKVLKWIIDGLRVFDEREVDAVVRAVLPWGGCEWFAEVVRRVVVRSGGGGRRALKWDWVAKVARAGGVVGGRWMAEACPVKQWWGVVEDGTAMEADGVNVAMVARFVAVVGVAKMVRLSARKRAVWVPRVLAVIGRLRGEGDGELMYALLMCVAAAVWAGVDGEVGEVVGRVVGGACEKWEGKLRACGVECLGVVVERGGVVGSEVALGLLKVGGLGEQVCDACMEGLMRGEPGLAIVEGVAKGMGELGPKGVSDVVQKLLRLFSDPGGVEYEEAEVRGGLVQVLGKLGRGKFAGSFDEGLRHHFAKRRKEGHGRYAFVDSVLTEALAGTPYQVLKGEVESSGVVVGTVMAMMVHPEAKVRIAALEKVKECAKGQSDVALIHRCVDMVKEDPKLAVASCAAECLIESAVDGQGIEFLEVITNRLRKELQALGRKKKRKQSARDLVDSYAKNAFRACTGVIENEPLAVKALVIGLLMDEGVCEIVTRVGMGDNVMSLLCTPTPGADIVKDDSCLETDLHKVLTTALKALVSSEGFDCEPLVTALARWDTASTMAVLRLWFKHLCGHPERRDPSLARSLLEGIRTVTEKVAGNPIGANDVIELAVAPLCSLSKSNNSARLADDLWHLACSKNNPEFESTALRSLISSIGLENTLQVLRRVTLETSGNLVHAAVKSLKWFIGLSENHDDPRIQRCAILAGLCAFYGDNKEMRTEMKRLCEARRGAAKQSAADKNQVCVMRQCLREVSNLSTMEIAALTTGKDAGDAGISSTMFSALREQNGRSMPLVSSKSAVKSARFMFEYALSTILEKTTATSERLYLLRAIEGFELGQGPFVVKILQLLHPIAEAADIPSQVRAETILRASHLLTPKVYKSVDRDSVLDSIRYFASGLQTLPDNSSKEEVSLLDVHNAVVMVTGQLLPLFHAVAQPRVKGDNPGAQTYQTLLGLLLAVSVKSSPAGRCARVVLDRVCRVRVGVLVPFVDGFFGDHHKTFKKQRRDSVSEGAVQDKLKSAAGQGSIETLRRILSSESVPLFQQNRRAMRSLVSSMWIFVTAAMSDCKDKTSFLEEDQEYNLQTVLDVLLLLHRQEAEMKKPIDKSVDQVKLGPLMRAAFYAGLAGDEYQTALRLAIRRTALRLVDTLTILHAKLVCTELSQAVNNIIRQKTLVSLQFLQSFAPVLIRSGCDFGKLCNWLSQATFYASGKAGTSADYRQMIASCCHHTEDPETAAATCVQVFAKKALDYLSLPTAAQESSHVLLSTNSRLLTDLVAISRVEGRVRCELASVYFLQSEFQSKLDDAVRDPSLDNEDLVTGFSTLYQALLESADSSENEAIAAILGILPLPALKACVIKSLTISSPRLVARGLASLLNRLKARDIELSYSWKIGEGDIEFIHSQQEAAEGAFLSGVGAVLCEAIEKETKERSEGGGENEADLTRMALECMQVLSERIGTSSGESLLKFSAAPCSVLSSSWGVAAMSEPTGDEQHAMCVATAFRCLASMAKRLGNEAITFVPKTVRAAVGVLSCSFAISKQRSPVSNALVESSACLCRTVLERMPKLFGRNALHTMAKVVLSRNVRQCNDVFFQAMDNVPVSVSLASMSVVTRQLHTMEVTAEGVVTVIKGVSAIISSMKRSELTKHSEGIMRIALNSVEFCHGNSVEQLSSHHKMTSGETSSEGGKLTYSHGECLLVDEAFAEAMTNMILKLSETGFKELFGKLVMWLEAGRLPGAMSAISFGGGVQVYQNMTRAVPFLRLSLQLLRTLQSLYVPYFFQLLDQVLDIIRNGEVESEMIVEESEGEGENGAKKRKRERMEKEEKQLILRKASLLAGDLYKLGLDNLKSFMRQELNDRVLTPTVVRKIQESLLSAFDRHQGDTEELRAVFVGLATRIISVGSMQESREESRTLLMGLVREVLGRTRESEVKMRAGSLRICRAIAGEVGDDVLVCLPEVMVVLAEVVDDEEGSVRAECDEFIGVLEGLGGEGIRESLRS